MTFEYEKLESNAAVIAAINNCEGRHVQQTCYSTYMGALTQICFTCQKIRSVISWAGAKSWGGERT